MSLANALKFSLADENHNFIIKYFKNFNCQYFLIQNFNLD